MKSTGVLVKLSGSLDSHRAALVAAAPTNHEIKPLFTTAAEPPSHGQAATTAAALPPQTWVLVKPRADGLAAQAAVQHPWDTAHEIRRQLGARALPDPRLASRRSGAQSPVRHRLSWKRRRAAASVPWQRPLARGGRAGERPN